MKCAIICGASFACGALGAIQLVVSAGCPDALMVLPLGAWAHGRKLPLGAHGRKLPPHPGTQGSRTPGFQVLCEKLLIDTQEKSKGFTEKQNISLSKNF